MGRSAIPRMAIHGGLILSVFAVISVANRDSDAFELPTSKMADITSFFEGVTPQMVVMRQPTFGVWGSKDAAKVIKAKAETETPVAKGTVYRVTAPRPARPLSEVSTADQLATARAIQDEKPLLALQLYSELRLQDPKNATIWLETGRILERLEDPQAARVSYESAFNLAVDADDSATKVAALTRLAALAAPDTQSDSNSSPADVVIDTLHEDDAPLVTDGPDAAGGSEESAEKGPRQD
jgi:hypothetical protein